MLPALCLFLITGVCNTVSADTDIAYFSTTVENSASIAHTHSWPTLSGERNEGRWTLQPAKIHVPLGQVCEDSSPRMPCPHELWLALDTTHERWRRHSKFTLRLSWPGFHPARFRIDVYTPEALSQSSAATPALRVHRNRLRYARIRAVDIGVLPASSALSEPELIPFVLILEPLYLDLIPASVLPVILFLVPLVVFASLTVPHIYRYLSQVADQSREELRKAE